MKNYRILKDNEIIKAGDQVYYRETRGWRNAMRSQTWSPLEWNNKFGTHYRWRRPIKTTKPTYKILKASDKIEKTDEVMRTGPGGFKWEKANWAYSPVNARDREEGYIFRRLIVNKTSKTRKPTEPQYRYLKTSEIIKKNDEFSTQEPENKNRKWEKAWATAIGDWVWSSEEKHKRWRRKV